MSRRVSLLGLCWAMACSAAPGDVSPSGLHPLGYRYDPSEHHAFTTVNHALGSNPTSADVSQYSPPVGDQGQIGDCTTWAIGYGLSGWLANQAGLNGGKNFFAPMFIFTAFAPKGSTDFGITGLQALNYLIQNGIDTAADYDQNAPANFPTTAGASVPGLGIDASANDNVDPPNAAQQKSALSYKITLSKTVFDTGPTQSASVCPGKAGATGPIQSAIASGVPVVIAIPVYPQFDNYDGMTPVAPPAATDKSRGGHMLLCTKYDANGVWCQNSWGASWGHSGLVQLGYPFVEQCIVSAQTASGIGQSVLQSIWLKITSLQADAAVQGTVPINIFATDVGTDAVQSVAVQINGNQVGMANGDGTYSFELDTTQLANGMQTLTAVATDSMGNQITSPDVPINVDNGGSAPAADGGALALTISAPTSGQTVRGTLAVPVQAAGEAGGATVSQIEMWIDGDSTSAAFQAGDTVQFSLDTTLLGDGLHTLTASATASDGETASATVSFTVDNSGPVLTWDSPAAGSTLNGTVSFTVDASDTASAIAQVVFFVNGDAVGTATSAPYSVTWDSTQVSDGPVSVSASAIDGVGNSSSTNPLQLTVQNGGGSSGSGGGGTINVQFGADVTTAVAQPVNGVFNVDVAVTDGDAAASITEVDFYVGGQQVGQVTSAPYALGFDTTQIADGSYTLAVNALDSQGNSGQATLGITIQNSLSSGPTPVLTVQFGNDLTSLSQAVTGTLVIDVTVLDSSPTANITSVVFSVDGQAVGEADSPPYEIAWDTTTVSDGTHSLTATANDDQGGSGTTAPLSVTVGN